MSVGSNRSRLSLTIYLVGLLQLVVAAAAIVAVHRLLERAPWEHERARARGVLLAVGEMWDSPPMLRRALSQLNAERMIEMSFYRADGERVASTEPPLPALSADELERVRHAGAIELPRAEPGALTVTGVVRDGSLVGYGMTRIRREHGLPPGRHGPQRPPLVTQSIREPAGIAAALMGAAFIAFLFARSLARPLARLAAAAEAFGSGDLNARTDLRRNDEIGAVARTFDEMAERVNALLHTQREFLANVSHELRTPLARIRVALDIAAEGDVDAARESLGDIAQDWGDLDRLVESLLAIARLDLASDPDVPAAALRFEPLDAVTLVDRAAVGFRGAHPTHTLTVEHEGEAIPLVADGSMLRRVLDNLLGNAAKYSDAGAPIRLEVRPCGRVVEFVVSDRGIGIDAADLPHLFEPFFRTDRMRTRKTGGVGLGLALAKRIVDAHGGRILVDSRVGVGTTVAFTVPDAPCRS